MRERIVEIAEEGKYLSCRDGFLVVSENGHERGRVPLDDVGGVIATARSVTFSRSLVDALASRGATFVLCGTNFAPSATLVPVTGHHAQGERMRAQAAVSLPARKRAWQAIVRCKLAWQAAALQTVGAPHEPLAALVQKVRSGDTANVEAQGARRYWTLMFGKAFRRDPDASGCNALLNYGYAVMRSAAARAISAAGLHPGLGIFHGSHKNAMPLADDLMEPFRCITDVVVKSQLGKGFEAPDPVTKRHLVKALYLDIDTAQGISPLTIVIQRLAASLADLFMRSAKELDVPCAPIAESLRKRIDQVVNDGDSHRIPIDVDNGDV